MQLRPIRGGERGVAALSLLTVGAIIALAIFAFVAVPLTDASAAKAKNRSAADAAALAGADFIKKDLEAALTDNGWLGDWQAYQSEVGTGLLAARNYAERNGSELVAYNFDVANWEAYAKVRGREVDGAFAESDATATLDLPECHKLDTVPTPEPTAPPTPPDPDEEEPPPLPDTYSCGGIKFDISTDDGPPTLDPDIIDALLDQAHVKLID